MARLILLAAALLALACGEAPIQDERLIGTWRSDKAATLAEIDAIGGFTPQQRRSLEATLGRRSIHYSGSRVTSRRRGVDGVEGEVTASAPYRIVAVRGHEIVVESHDHDLGSSERQSVFVEGDWMWIWLADGRWRELYHRVL